MAPPLTETVACLLRAPLLLTPSYCGLLYMSRYVLGGVMMGPCGAWKATYRKRGEEAL